MISTEVSLGAIFFASLSPIFFYIISSVSFDHLVVDIICKVLPSTKNNKCLSSIASI